jgi:Tfp pilus assembly ATPase PilU
VIQDCIRNSDRTYEINEFISKGRNYGMQTFDQALLRQLRSGLIAREVAISAATSPGDLDLQLRMGLDEDELAIEGHRESSYNELPLQFELPPSTEVAAVEDKDLDLAQQKPKPPLA